MRRHLVSFAGASAAAVIVIVLYVYLFGPVEWKTFFAAIIYWNVAEDIKKMLRAG